MMTSSCQKAGPFSINQSKFI